jgi:hypothetical protein
MSITSANAVVVFTLPPIFVAPYQLEQFAADNVFGTDPIDATETSMGIDGVLTGGFVNNPTRQTFHLQADSPANYFFEQWFQQQKAQQDTYIASGTITLRSLGKKYNMVRGFLRSYMSIADAARTMQPIRNTIEWQAAIPQPS